MPKTTERLGRFRTTIVIVTVLLLSLLLNLIGSRSEPSKRVPYTEFVAAVNDGRVERAEIWPDQIRATVRGEADKPAVFIITDRLPKMEERDLLDAMQRKGVVVSGATMQLPTQERYLMRREELRDRICVLLGGRAAEELACGGISTGAQDDLERARWSAISE